MFACLAEKIFHPIWRKVGYSNQRLNLQPISMAISEIIHGLAMTAEKSLTKCTAFKETMSSSDFGKLTQLNIIFT